MVLQLVKVHFVPVESMNRDDNKSKRNIISNDMLVSELEPCGTFKKKHIPSSKFWESYMEDRTRSGNGAVKNS